MSNSNLSPRIRPPRIKRRRDVGRNFTKYNVRDAFPYLLEDFKGRCAYSMQHVEQIGEVAMHIDHFDPRKKKRYKQAYSNLYLASSQCNISKSNTWPTWFERASGVRFLDPCDERDYGSHIFEDPTSHELIGTTPAGRYQILMCDLNAQHLVLKRRTRTAVGRILFGPGEIKSDFATALEAITELRKEYERSIPSIPPLLPNDASTVL